MDKFLNLRVRLSTGEEGVIESGFGKSGKFKVRVADGLKSETMARLKKKGKSAVDDGGGPGSSEAVQIILEFKRWVLICLQTVSGCERKASRSATRVCTEPRIMHSGTFSTRRRLWCNEMLRCTVHAHS